MPLDNLNSNHYEEGTKTTVLDLITQLEAALANHLVNLSPEERQSKGSINEQNKLIINKAKDYQTSEPGKSSPDVDWAEYDADYSDREFSQGLELRLASLAQGITNARILNDYDLYQAALLDYDYAKYKLGTGDAGYEQKVNEYKQFFSGGRPPASNSGEGDGTVEE